MAIRPKHARSNDSDDNSNNTYIAPIGRDQTTEEITEMTTEVNEYPEPSRGVSVTVSESAQPAELQTWFYDNFAALAMDPNAVARQIASNISHLEGESVLDVKESLDSASVIEYEPIRLLGVNHVSPSSFGGIYIVLDIVLLNTGETTQVTVGSPTLIAQLKALITGNALPIECKIVPIRRGGKDGHNPPLYFRRLNY